jgi:pyrroloquinoline-quinone synthase
LAGWAEISQSKIDGLKKFYGIDDALSLEFFTAHQQYDVEHARKVAELIEQYADPEKAKAATRQACQALSGFLDGMCRVSQLDSIHCN